MNPDIDKYRRFVDRFDLTDDQKVEIIHTLWNIVGGFACRAFGLDPVRQVTGGPGLEDASGKPPVLEFEMLPNKDNSLTGTFGLKARRRGRRKSRKP